MVICLSRLSENFPRETVSLVLNVSEQIHLETVKELEKRKFLADKEIFATKKSISDLKRVVAEIGSEEDKNLEDIFEISDFMKNQKKLLPTEMLTYSLEKFESQLQKSLTRLTISLDKCQAKSESITAIIQDLKESKNSTLKKVAKDRFL